MPRVHCKRRQDRVDLLQEPLAERGVIAWNVVVGEELDPGRSKIAAEITEGS